MGPILPKFGIIEKPNELFALLEIGSEAAVYFEFTGNNTVQNVA
jgi:hypothetical protein